MLVTVQWLSGWWAFDCCIFLRLLFHLASYIMHIHNRNNLTNKSKIYFPQKLNQSTPYVTMYDNPTIIII